MARAGSFGTSLNPFGSSSSGGLSQYNVGDNLRDLEAYRAEVAWGNGLITDKEYQASLVKLVAAADSGSLALMSAQNKLDDVTYRIGRSEADAKSPDALIAFDQKALAGMNTSNLRYRDVKSSLDSELAQRRSRDYGKIVDDYNLGKTSTESLFKWVQKTISILPADAPDKDNWDSVRSSLTDRLVSEKDAKVYQDYQDRKMTPVNFLAYLQGRRDAYTTASPKWAEADRRLKDGEKNVRDTANSAADQVVFNNYNNGKVSDTAYLQYLSKRIDGMAADDPARGEWKQRLTQAAHSLAEDKLRTDVSLATTASGQAHAARNLIAFYKAYASTLNPGSAEYRATQVSIHTLGGYASGGGGGGGKKKSTPAPSVAGTIGMPPKIISPTSNVDTLIHLTTPNANASKKARAIAVAGLNLNNGHATDALSHGDAVWLFVDPTRPGQTVTRQNFDGTIWKDANGKTMQVPGSVYLPTSSNAVAAFDDATATYSYGLAGIALKHGDTKGYLVAYDHASTAENGARNHRATAVIKDVSARLDTLDKGVDYFTSIGDAASVVNLLRAQYNTISPLLDNPYLSEAQADSLGKKLQKVLDNPLSPEAETDINGESVPGGKQVGGWVDGANSPRDAQGNFVPGGAVMYPDVHYMLDHDSKGEAKWGWVHDDGPPGSWELSHVQVQTGRNGQVVPGEVKIETAPVGGQRMLVHTPDGDMTIPWTGGAQYIAYHDGDGNDVTAYSIDAGKTWVQTTGGVLPVIEMNGMLTKGTNDKGELELTDANGNVYFTGVPDQAGIGVKWTAATGLISTALESGGISWYGQAHEGVGDVGAPGSQFRIVSSEGGSLNFIPNSILFAEQARARAHADLLRVNDVPRDQATAKFAAAGVSDARTRAALLRINATPQEQANESTSARAHADLLRVNADRPFNAGAFVSNIGAQVVPVIRGIISIGTAVIPAIRPPVTLPPAYLHPAPLRVITPTQLPSRTTTQIVEPPPVRTPAPLPPRVIAPTQLPSRTTTQIVEPPPAPVRRAPPPLVKTKPVGW